MLTGPLSCLNKHTCIIHNNNKQTFHTAHAAQNAFIQKILKYINRMTKESISVFKTIKDLKVLTLN